MGKNFQLSGLQKALKEVRDRTLAVGSGSKKEIEKTIRNIERDAKRNAPVDTGELRQSIKGELTESGYNGMVTASAPHAPYIEFGTGNLVEVPEGFESQAAEAKGEGKRQVNIAPQPYLIPAYLTNVTGFIAKMKKVGGLRWK